MLHLSKLKIIPLICAAMVHVLIAVMIMETDKPVTVLPSQTIQVSLVKPSVPKQNAVLKKTENKQQQPEKPDEIKIPEINPRETGMVIKEKNTVAEAIPEEPEQDISDDEMSEAPLDERHEVQQITTGIADSEATEELSAISEPVAAAYLNNPPPSYPRLARLRRQQGTVLLNVEVEANGRPGDIQVIKSSGYQLLDQAAINIVRKWRFLPAKRGNEPVKANVEIPITFQIKRK
ncbi:MAG: energy transducer TonB [Alphaproteobacteria bacterium]|nr:energy transducer TonB [Alphaproteobacteria bacterium]